jgi:hypothetical protein
MGVLLLGLVAAICLAILAALVTPSWSPLLRSPLPDSSVVSVADGIIVPERLAPSRGPTQVRRGDPAAMDDPGDNSPAPAPVPDVEQPPPAALAQPEVVVSAPSSPERDTSVPDGGRVSPVPAASAVPVPDPAPPTEGESPPEAPPPPPEAVLSTHPGQGNAYGKGNGNGPPGGVPPGQVGR